jgi:hypothetical protein
MQGEPVSLVVGGDYTIRQAVTLPTGIDPADLIGLKVWSLVPRRWRQTVRQAHRVVFEQGRLAWLRLAAFHPESNGIMHYECRAVPICHEGKPLAAVVHAIPLDGRDILGSRPLVLRAPPRGLAVPVLAEALRFN